jgi:hypothetical protein
MATGDGTNIKGHVETPLTLTTQKRVAPDPPKDWADELATEVLAEVLVMLGARSSHEARQLLAVRFRLVKEQGFAAGLGEATRIVSGSFENAREVPRNS